MAEKTNTIIEYNLRAPMTGKVLELVAKSNVLVAIGSDIHPEVKTIEKKTLEELLVENKNNIEKVINTLRNKGISERRIINTFEWQKVKKFLGIK